MITRFGSGSQLYDFTASHIVLGSYHDNFGDVVTETARLPGVSGVFDEYGSDAAPKAGGMVRQSLTLIASTREGMDALLDDLKAMAGWPKKRLWRQPTDPNENERYCWARINNISAPRQEDQHTNLWQPVTITWQVAYPYWLQVATEQATWGGGWSWGGGAVWGGTSGYPVSGTQTDISIAISGKAETIPRMVLACGTGETCQNPTIQRVVDGSVVDDVSYTGTLTAGDSLEINAKALSVKLNNVSVYNDFDYNHPAWMRLLPGNNTIRVTFANAGDAGTFKLFYDEAYN